MTKKQWFLVFGIFVLILGILWGRSDSPDRKKQAKVAPTTTEVAPMEPTKSLEDEAAEKVSAASIYQQRDPLELYGEAREKMISIQDLLIELQRLKALYEDSDPKRFARDEKELKKKLHEMLKDGVELVAQSDMAQEELLSRIESEEDDKVKRGLARLFKGISEEKQAEYYGQLTSSDSESNQTFGVKMLSKMPNEVAMNNLVDFAHRPETSSKLKGKAIMGLTVSMGRAESDSSYPTQASARLYELAETSSDPKVRMSAYNAIAMKTNFTAEDEEFLNRAVQNETDKKARRAAELAKKVMNRRNRG